MHFLNCLKVTEPAAVESIPSKGRSRPRIMFSRIDALSLPTPPIVDDIRFLFVKVPTSDTVLTSHQIYFEQYDICNLLLISS